MTTLIRKDLRLLLEALRPWGLIIAALVVALLLATGMPQLIRPFGLGAPTLASILGLVVTVISMSAIAAAAWCAAAVVHGDARHGARLLSPALPTSTSARVGSKLLTIIVALGLITAVATCIEAMSARWIGRAWLVGRFVLAMSLIGASLALVVAPLSRARLLATLVFAMVLGALAIGCSTISHWLSFGWLARDLFEAARLTGSSEEMIAIQGRAWFAAMEWGLTAASVVAAIFGTLALLKPRSRLFTIVGLGAVLAAALTAGVVGSERALARDYNAHSWGPYRRLVALRADDATVLAAIEQYVRGQLVEYSLVVEGDIRALERPRDASGENAFTRALAGRTFIGLLPVTTPDEFVHALAQVAHDPASEANRLHLWSTIMKDPSIGAPDMRSVDGMLLANLEALARGDHPEKERIRRALSALKTVVSPD